MDIYPDLFTYTQLPTYRKTRMGDIPYQQLRSSRAQILLRISFSIANPGHTEVSS